MELDLKFSSGAESEYGESEVEVPPFATTTAKICFVSKHGKKVQNLKPGQAVTVTLKGTVESIETAAATDGVEGDLCLIVTELSASRGSEYDALLDEGE